jgi:hypothetical protein
LSLIPKSIRCCTVGISGEVFLAEPQWRHHS